MLRVCCNFVRIFNGPWKGFGLFSPGMWSLGDRKKYCDPSGSVLTTNLMKPLTRQWLTQADYDLATAKAMFKTKRYVYVAFMCQQATEKLIKGIIQERTGTTPPFSHNLPMLLKVANVFGDADRLDLLDLLTGYYINARYPEDKQKMAQELNKETLEAILKRTKECLRWLRKELEISVKS